MLKNSYDISPLFSIWSCECSSSTLTIFFIVTYIFNVQNFLQLRRYHQIYKLYLYGHKYSIWKLFLKNIFRCYCKFILVDVLICSNNRCVCSSFSGHLHHHRWLKLITAKAYKCRTEQFLNRSVQHVWRSCIAAKLFLRMIQ